MRLNFREDNICNMFFCVFSKQACINSFDSSFYRYHFFKVAITAKFGVSFLFHANSVKVVEAVNTLESKLIFVYHLTLIKAKTPWSLIKVAASFDSFIGFIVLFILLGIGWSFDYFKIESWFWFIVFLYFLWLLLISHLHPSFLNQFRRQFPSFNYSLHLCD